MAVIDSVNGSRVRERTTGPLAALLDLDLGLPAVDQLVAEIREEIADEVWAWYRENEDEPVVEFGLRWWKPIKIPLSRARWVIEDLVGPEPEPEPDEGGA